MLFHFHTHGLVAQSGRAPALQAGGPEFKSRRVHLLGCNAVRLNTNQTQQFVAAARKHMLMGQGFKARSNLTSRYV